MNPGHQLELAEVLAGSRSWTVIHGDNTEVLPGLPEKAVEHVITDPPYEAEAHTLQRRVLSRQPGHKGVRSHALDFGAITDETRTAFAEQASRLASRWSLVFCQAEAVHPWRAAFNKGGARYIRPCIWVKPNGQPQLTGDRPGMGYESIVCAHTLGRCRWNGGGRLGVFSHAVEANFSPEPRLHPTQKPLTLMLELVELFTDPGELVLDPFCGSGTTGAACLRLGRRFIGIERDERYAGLSRERLEAETKGLGLRDARAGQQSLFG